MMESRFDALEKETDARFEAVDARFDALERKRESDRCEILLALYTDKRLTALETLRIGPAA